jgi:hypothetical protein
MNGMYLWLTWVIAFVHGLLVAGVTVGILLAIIGVIRRNARWERILYSLLAGLIVSELLFGACFLTLWEKSLRERHLSGSAYRGSFIGHYLPWLLVVVQGWTSAALIAITILAAPFWRWVDRRRARS